MPQPDYGHKIVDTGFYQKVEEGFKDKIPTYNPKTQDHFWIMITSYRCDPELALKGEGIMDMETLVSVAGPLCYYCETPYSKFIAHRRCKGEPI